MSGFDPQSAIRDDWNAIRQQVIQQKRKEWEDKGYHKFTVRDLARKDERTGRIFYINPNDSKEDWERPGYQGFTMEQAKTWVDITNEELNDQWKKECRELEQQYIQTAMPRFNLYAYKPVYDSLNETEQEFVGIMTEPYAITDSNGNVLGFNCDLNAITKMAKQMAAKYSSGEQAASQTPAVNNVRQPVTDIRSSAGGSKTGPAKEINNVADAMRVVIAEERARKAGK